MEPTIVSDIINAVQGAHWAVLAGLVLTVLVWVARRICGEDRLPAKYIPLVNAGIAVVVAVADLLVRGTVWYEALGTGFLVGATAGGLWSILGKHILPVPDKEE